MISMYVCGYFCLIRRMAWSISCIVLNVTDFVGTRALSRVLCECRYVMGVSVFMNVS